MRNSVYVFFLLLFSALTWGANGSIEIVGSGDASSPPQFARLSVLVVSICYDQSRTAKDANAQLANQVVDLFKRFTQGTKDTVTTTGGPNERETIYVPVPNGTSRILCERKWKATNGIHLQTAAIKALPDIQDEVLKLIDRAEDIDPTKVTQTYAQLEQPTFFCTRN
jgi:uncharacterized protein YggE